MVLVLGCGLECGEEGLDLLLALDVIGWKVNREVVVEEGEVTEIGEVR